ncbi:aminotransferase class III-fold pyridoxal phosphate-dependent enzyme, partial [Streptomyces sp. UNOC14_S4]|uniref:aminotransferase class III-fold pyridoxal phosphate-dependent enzyme n=1 Tax=Streptomyces sp. UNOC14_S4 TaxID=2872340 RepID=UPI001E4B2CF7
MTVTQLPLRAPWPRAHDGSLRGQPERRAADHTYARSLPVVPVRARGLTVEGADGRRYLDCHSGTSVLGHNHPVVLEAIRAVLDSGAPLSTPEPATPLRDAFTGELFATLPGPLADRARVRFCEPSAEGTARAVRALVRAATGHTELLPLAEQTSADVFSDRPADVLCGLSADSPSGLSADALFARLASGARPPAGVAVAAVAGNGDTRVTPESLLRRARDLTAARAIPLVVDETATGVGRTGAFWAVEHSGIVPDAMVLGRTIGGGLPLAAVVHHEGLGADRPADDFQGNQLAMAAGAATLRYVRENGLALRAAALGAHLLGRLRGLAREHACLGDVRGLGLMTGIVCAPGTAAAVRSACLRRGLIVGPGGGHSSVVCLLPPLTITGEQLEAVLDRLSDAVAAVARTHPAA